MPRVVADTNIYILRAQLLRNGRRGAGPWATVLVHPAETVNLVRDDEADNRILECALAARADTIITGDHHLLQLGHFFGARITTPRQFLNARTRR